MSNSAKCKTQSSKLGKRKQLCALRFALCAPSAGFTLIEILVSIALVSILAGIGISIWAITSNAYTKTNAISLMQTQGSQVMEQMQQGIRSASAVSVNNCDGNGCTLDLTIPTNSLEYQSNGGCPHTVYQWINENATNKTNGQLKRYYLDSDDSSSCANNTTTSQLFDTDSAQGISVVQLGTNLTFVKNTGNDNIDSVVISLQLTQGVSRSNRVSIPLQTTVGLRDY